MLEANRFHKLIPAQGVPKTGEISFPPATDDPTPGPQFDRIDHPEDMPPASHSKTIFGKIAVRTLHLFKVGGALTFGFIFFYLLADWSSFSTGQQRLGQLVFSNTMTQLWTAAYRLAFILAASGGLFGMVFPEQFKFYRPDRREGPDMDSAFRFELTSYQRLCVTLSVFFAICLLFVILLTVSLPESVSVGP